MSDFSSEPLDASLLKGKSVLITGDASGLGRETAILLAHTGAYVTIADIQSGDQIVEELKSNGHDAQYPCDVMSWDSQVKAFQTALAFSPTKSIDIVAIFAAIDSQGHLIDQATCISPSIYGDVPNPQKYAKSKSISSVPSTPRPSRYTTPN